MLIARVLGEVVADSLAVPGEPLTSAGAGDEASSSTATGASPAESSQLTGATPGLSGSSALPGTVGAGTAVGSPGASGGQRAAPTGGQGSVLQPVAATKPSWLLLLYFCWQCLVFGTAASLWWWRKAPAS